jgi:hypothetical protein
MAGNATTSCANFIPPRAGQTTRNASTGGTRPDKPDKIIGDALRIRSAPYAVSAVRRRQPDARRMVGRGGDNSSPQQIDRSAAIDSRPAGEQFGMHPAIEINLHVDDVCAAQRWNPTALESASRELHEGHQPAPFDAAGQDLRAFER